MTETPPSFAAPIAAAAAARRAGGDAAGRPADRRGLPDGEFHRAVRGRRPSADETSPLAHLRHVSVFHSGRAGRCMIEHASGDAARDRGRRPGAAAVRGRAQVLARRPAEFACRAGHRPAGTNRRHAGVQPRRRRQRDPVRLRLPRIGRIYVRADVPLAARDAGRSDRRRRRSARSWHRPYDEVCWRWSTP